jgi:hypothetical protein
MNAIMYGCLFGCVCREKCKYELLLLDCILLSEFHDDKKKKYRMPIWIPADKSLFLQSTWHSNLIFRHPQSADCRYHMFPPTTSWDQAIASDQYAQYAHYQAGPFQLWLPAEKSLWSLPVMTIANMINQLNSICQPSVIPYQRHL